MKTSHSNSSVEQVKEILQKELQDFFRVPVSNYFKVPWLPIQWVLDKGLPLGRIVEIFGPEQSAKSTFTYQVLGTFAKQGGLSVIIDTESSFVPSWITQLGFDVSDFVIVQPACIEEVFEALKKILETTPYETPLAIAWDSVFGTPTKAQLEGKFEIASAARILSSRLPTVIKALYERQALAIFINQARTVLNMYGQPTIDSPGGYALRHDAAMRIMFQKNARITRGQSEIIGYEISISVVKSKVGEPFRTVKVPFLKSKGFDRVAIAINAALNLGLLEMKGAWIKWKDKSHTRWNLESWSEDEIEEIEKLLEEKYGIGYSTEESIDNGTMDREVPA